MEGISQAGNISVIGVVPPAVTRGRKKRSLIGGTTEQQELLYKVVSFMQMFEIEERDDGDAEIGEYCAVQVISLDQSEIDVSMERASRGYETISRAADEKLESVKSDLESVISQNDEYVQAAYKKMKELSKRKVDIQVYKECNNFLECVREVVNDMQQSAACIRKIRARQNGLQLDGTLTRVENALNQHKKYLVSYLRYVSSSKSLKLGQDQIRQANYALQKLERNIAQNIPIDKQVGKLNRELKAAIEENSPVDILKVLEQASSKIKGLKEQLPSLEKEFSSLKGWIVGNLGTLRRIPSLKSLFVTLDAKAAHVERVLAGRKTIIERMSRQTTLIRAELEKKLVSK